MRLSVYNVHIGLQNETLSELGTTQTEVMSKLT